VALETRNKKKQALSVVACSGGVYRVTGRRSSKTERNFLTSKILLSEHVILD